MKLLKSGIEIDRSELNKIRGAACACGCGIGFSGEQLVVSGDEGNTCMCGCIGDVGVYNGDLNGGLKIILPKD